MGAIPSRPRETQWTCCLVGPSRGGPVAGVPRVRVDMTSGAVIKRTQQSLLAHLPRYAGVHPTGHNTHLQLPSVDILTLANLCRPCTCKDRLMDFALEVAPSRLSASEIWLQW